MRRVYNCATPGEQRWIARIILKGVLLLPLCFYAIMAFLPSSTHFLTFPNAHYAKSDMVISVKETTVFSVFHPDAQDLFNACSDLKKVAWELWDPLRRLNDEVLFVRFPHSQTKPDVRSTISPGQINSIISPIRPHAM